RVTTCLPITLMMIGVTSDRSFDADVERTPPAPATASTTLEDLSPKSALIMRLPPLRMLSMAPPPPPSMEPRLSSRLPPYPPEAIVDRRCSAPVGAETCPSTPARTLGTADRNASWVAAGVSPMRLLVLRTMSGVRTLRTLSRMEAMLHSFRVFRSRHGVPPRTARAPWDVG